MSYTRPIGTAADAGWAGESAYTRPAGNAADATWQFTAPTVSGLLQIPSPLGAPALRGSATVAVDGVIVVPGPLASVAVVGAPVIAARAAIVSPLAPPAAVALVVRRACIATPSPLGLPIMVGTVLRYELRGEVRDQGVLVNRRVRAYRRDTGALAADADTAAGLFVLPVGFAADEYYLVPINLDAAATDFAPPCANRVTSVLATDVPA